MRLLDMDRNTPLSVSFSGGKDSVATVKLLHAHGFKNVTCVYAHFYFDKDKNIPAILPEHENFVMCKMQKIITSVYQYKFIAVEPEHDFIYHFMLEQKRSKYENRNGKINGFPISHPKSRCWVNSRLKVNAINKATEIIGDCIQVIGLAHDEQDRISRIIDNNTKFSILDELHVTEHMAMNICKTHNILSPIYEHSQRDGCWFCPNSLPPERQYILKIYPYLVKELHCLDMDSKALRVEGNSISWNAKTKSPMYVKEFFSQMYKRKENHITLDEINSIWTNIERG